MSGSAKRVRRVFAATRDLIDAIHPGTGAESIKRLRKRFLAPAAIFESGAHILEGMGMHHSDALLLSLIPELSRYTQIERFGSHALVNTLVKAEEYVRPLFLGHAYEHFFMLALNAEGRLLSCVLLQKGTTNKAPFYVRNVLSEVVRTHASAIVICHNHPGSTLMPSQSDINCTLSLIAALEPLGVPLLDHLIVADHKVMSIRDARLIRDALWLAQAPGDPLVQNWLSL